MDMLSNPVSFLCMRVVSWSCVTCGGVVTALRVTKQPVHRRVGARRRTSRSMLGPAQLDVRKRRAGLSAKRRSVAGLRDCWISRLLDAGLHCWIALLDCTAGLHCWTAGLLRGLRPSRKERTNAALSLHRHTGFFLFRRSSPHQQERSLAIRTPLRFIIPRREPLPAPTPRASAASLSSPLAISDRRPPVRPGI